MKLSDEIMADLRKKKSASSGGDDGDAEDMKDGGADEETEDGGDYAGDEVKAMDDFENAQSTEEKVSAMKAFLEVCVPKIVNSMK